MTEPARHPFVPLRHPRRALALTLALAVTALAQPRPGTLSPMTIYDGIDNPAAAVFDPRLDYVYALGGSDPSTAYSLRFGGTAVLAPAASAPAGRYANLIAAHPAGGRFYAVSGSEVHGYIVDSATGALTSLTPVALGAANQAQNMPTSLVIDPTGRYLYVLQQVNQSSGSNNPSFNAVLCAYAIDAETGALTPLPGSPFARETASTDMTLSPDGRFAFIVVVTVPGAGGKGTLKAFERNTSDGTIGDDALSRLSTRTAQPGSIVAGADGTLYLAENANNNTGVDTVGVYRYSATGSLSAAGATDIPSFEQSGQTFGPYLSVAPARNLLFVAGYNNDEANNNPGFVAAFAINPDGTLPSQPVTTLQTPDAGQGPMSIAHDANGSFALSVESGDYWGWEDIRVYRTDVSPLALGDALAKGPRVSFSGGTIVLTDTLRLASARLQTVQNIENYGFGFFKPGSQQPDTQSQAYGVNASVRPLAANGNTVQGSFRLPLPPEDPTGVHLLNLNGYYVRTFVRVTGATYYGPETFVNVTPFVRTIEVSPGLEYVYLKGAVRRDRIPDRVGFRVTNGSRTKFIAATLSDTTIYHALDRDTLTAMTGSSALDTFIVSSFAVFGSDTLYQGDDSFANGPAVVLSLVSTTTGAATIYTTVRPWVPRDHTLVVYKWSGSQDKWVNTDVQCFDNADCAVAKLGSGTVQLRAQLRQSNTVLATTNEISVQLP